MMRSFIAATALLSVLGFTKPLTADIILSMQPNVVFIEGSGVQSFDILARTSAANPAAEALIGLTADIQIPNAVFVPRNPADLDNFNIGRVGQIGNNAGVRNLNAASSITIDNVGKFISLSMDFNSAQTFPTVNGSLLTIDINTNQMPVGIYDVIFVDVQANGASGSFASPSIGGSFQIAAVPEPSSMLLLAGSTVVGTFARRRSKRSESLAA